MPKLLDQHKLLGSKPGTRSADDAWVEKFANSVFAASADGARGWSRRRWPRVQRGGHRASPGAARTSSPPRPGPAEAWTSANKPIGSVHGDSVGVHSCDTIHAWRNLARAGDRRTQVTSLILAGYQVARDRNSYQQPDQGGNMLKWEPYPLADARDAVKGVAADSLMKELDAAIRDKNQPRASAITARISTENPDSAKDVFGLLRGFAISEDGALHAEKYYATTSDEFAAARAAFKWRQLIALARVTASAYGYPAPGHKEACELIKG